MPLVAQGSFQRLYNEKDDICIEYQAMLRKFFPNGNYEAAFDPFSDFFYEIDSIFQRSESCKNEIRVILNRTEIKTLESNSTDDKVDNPVSLYAATKKSNELFAHAYSKLYGIPSTGLRFFTVYGPAGRPDMAYFKFTNKIVKGEPIQIYNNGDMKRDFTYVDDIVRGVAAVMQKIPEKTEDGVPYKVYNIGNSKPEDLLNFVNTLEECLKEAGVIDKPVEKEFLPMQPGDVYQTFADTVDFEKDFGFKPTTTIKSGLSEFAKWYKNYY